MDPKIIRAWGQIIVSILALVLFGAVAIESFRINDQPMELMIVGAALGYAAAVVQFFVGSSAGSQTKDDVIAASNPPPKS